MAKNKTGEEIHVYTVCINGTRFSIKNPLKWFDKSSNYDIINNVCVDREFIPWNSRLKVTDHKYVNYDKVEARYSEKEAGERLKARFQSRLEEYREAGCRIVDQSLDIKKELAAYKAHGSIQLSISKMDKKMCRKRNWCCRAKERKMRMAQEQIILDIPASHENNIFGGLDIHLKKIERALDIEVILRDGSVRISGEKENLKEARRVLKSF